MRIRGKKTFGRDKTEALVHYVERELDGNGDAPRVLGNLDKVGYE